MSHNNHSSKELRHFPALHGTGPMLRLCEDKGSFRRALRAAKIERTKRYKLKRVVLTLTILWREEGCTTLQTRLEDFF
jgi:hypothetical protein